MTPYEHAKAIFLKMNIGDVIQVRDFAPKNKQLFIECAKQYIDETGDIEFNSDYTKLRRIK